MFDSLDEQEIKYISNDVSNGINIDQNEALLKNYQSQNFSKGQKYRKIFQKNKTKQKFREDCKKNKRKIRKPKAKKGAIKKASKKAINYMRKANYLQTDDDKNLMTYPL